MRESTQLCCVHVCTYVQKCIPLTPPSPPPPRSVAFTINHVSSPTLNKKLKKNRNTNPFILLGGTTFLMSMLKASLTIFSGSSGSRSVCPAKQWFDVFLSFFSLFLIFLKSVHFSPCQRQCCKSKKCVQNSRTSPSGPSQQTAPALDRDCIQDSQRGSFTG